VYALNQTDGVIAWSTNVGTPMTKPSSQCGNISPLGILGTPVIDVAAGRIYVSEILAADSAWHVFGIDLTSHLVVLNTTIPSSTGTGFDWTIEQQRGALSLANGYVYVPFGGRIGDCGPYHGWVIGVATNGSTTVTYYESPTTAEGIWAPGGAAIDDSTGNVFFATGNAIPCSGSVNSDSIIRTASTLGTATSFFQPQDWSTNWCVPDQDMGSVSPVLISPSLMFATGKYGQGFLLNPANLGGTNGQLFPSGAPYTGVDVCLGDHNAASYGSVAYAYGRVYFSCESNGIVSLSVNSSTPSFSSCDAACTASGTWHVGGLGTMSSPIVAGGAVWAISTSGGGLYGFNATTGAQIFHSANFSASRFSTPSEAGGQIFAGAGNVIRSFNMSSGACSGVTISAAPTSVSSGTHSIATAVATGCSTSPRYEFWLRPATSSTWQLVQPYGTSATYDWNSTGAAPGTVYLGVHVRDAGSGAPYDAVASTPVTVTTPSCASVSISAAPSSVSAGTHSIATASATGCTNSPRYEFWLRPATSSMWQLVQSYGTSATYDWNSTGAAAGTVYLGVHVRDANSTASYDAVASTPVTVTTPSCASVSISAAPTSVSGGTHSIATATATGCTNSPRYEFWLRPASSPTWQLVQSYGTSATYDWNSTGAAPGTVYLGVHVRDANSTASYDAVASTPVTVT
jgi:hypothetical protein